VKSPGKWRIIAVVTAVTLIMVALLGNTVGLSKGDGLGYGQLFVILAGIMLVFAGAFGRKFIGGYKSTAVIILNTLLLLALLEFSALILVKLIGIERVFVRNPREQIQSRSLEDTGLIFPDQEYHPFVMWRTSPLELPLMNVDQNGVRRTCWVSGDPKTRIFAIGGSAMWGWMVPDSSTIPSCMQKELNSISAFPVSITNLSQNAWVSTQEISELILRLRSGDVPDLVIFYDGANDMLASFENGIAGVVIGNSSIQRRLSPDWNHSREHSSALLNLVKNTNIYALIRFLTADESISSDSATLLVAAAPCFNDSLFNINELARETSLLYLGNYRIVEALSNEYGFQFYFFLQPLRIFQPRDSLSAEIEISNMEDKRLVEFASLVYEDILEGQEHCPQLISVQPSFSGVDGELFTDLCHLNSRGNEIVAEWITALLRERSTCLFFDSTSQE
jgi:hypothetical protein